MSSHQIKSSARSGKGYKLKAVDMPALSEGSTVARLEIAQTVSAAEYANLSNHSFHLQANAEAARFRIIQ